MIVSFFLDPSDLGRINESFLSDQQMMELFYIPKWDDDPRSYFNFNGDDFDACTWTGVTCNSEKRVSSIEWRFSFIRLTGEINFNMVPPNLTNLQFLLQDLTGEIPASAFPQTMKAVNIQGCKFSGTLNLDSLPRSLESLTFLNNRFIVIANLRNLPENLAIVVIGEEQNTAGTLHVGKLQKGLSGVHLGRSRLTEVVFEDATDASKVHW